MSPRAGARRRGRPPGLATVHARFGRAKAVVAATRQEQRAAGIPGTHVLAPARGGSCGAPGGSRAAGDGSDVRERKRACMRVAPEDPSKYFGIKSRLSAMYDGSKVWSMGSLFGDVRRPAARG